MPASLLGISIREFARRARCDDSIVRRKVKSGHLPALADGSLDPRHVDQDWRGGVPALPAVPAPAAEAEESDVDLDDAAEQIAIGGPGDWSKAEAERVKENFAARLRKLEFDRRSAMVVAIEDVVVAVAAEYALVRNKLLNIGSRVAPRVAVMRSAEEIKALIDKLVIEALEELTIDGPSTDDFGELRESLRDRFREPT